MSDPNFSSTQDESTEVPTELKTPSRKGGLFDTIPNMPRVTPTEPTSTSRKSSLFDLVSDMPKPTKSTTEKKSILSSLFDPLPKSKIK